MGKRISCCSVISSEPTDKIIRPAYCAWKLHLNQSFMNLSISHLPATPPPLYYFQWPVSQKLSVWTSKFSDSDHYINLKYSLWKSIEKVGPQENNLFMNISLSVLPGRCSFQRIWMKSSKKILYIHVLSWVVGSMFIPTFHISGKLYLTFPVSVTVEILKINCVLKITELL